MPSKRLLATLLLVACDVPAAEFRDSATEATVTTTTTTTTGGETLVDTDTAETSGTCDHDATTEDPESPETTTGESTTGESTTGESTTGESTTGQVTPLVCDPWLDDCLEGEKCVSHKPGPGLPWQAPTCSPVVGEPDALGEPCSVEPVDSCGEHAMCWNIDSNTGLGTCRALCSGSPLEPVCDAGEDCHQAAGGNLAVCLPNCSPIESTCSAGEVCMPRLSDSTLFVCYPDASGDEGQAFDACQYRNACDPGLGCMNVAFAGECDPAGIGCCLPYCDLSAPNTCPGQGLECLAWFESGYEPPGLENVGVCGLIL